MLTLLFYALRNDLPVGKILELGNCLLSLLKLILSVRKPEDSWVCLCGPTYAFADGCRTDKCFTASSWRFDDSESYRHKGAHGTGLIEASFDQIKRGPLLLAIGARRGNSTFKRFAFVYRKAPNSRPEEPR